MNRHLDMLQPYPFERLQALKAGVQPPHDREHIALSIGEPKHATPGLITEAVLSHLHNLSAYPSTRGLGELRRAICDWLARRFHLPADSLDPAHHTLPVNGTREALFAFAQAAIRTDGGARPLVVMPNPFYQIYEGAALLAGAEPHFVACTEASGFQPDYSAVAPEVWRRCQLLYLCTPANPTGAVLPIETLQELIRLSDRYGFVIASDECYSELYFDEREPPPGLLEAAAKMGRRDYRNCVVFHSLSKRSNAPGLRSGFVAGDPMILEPFLRYRTYHGCAMPLQHQVASARAWADEQHVIQNRALYREKFSAVAEILGDVLPIEIPPAGFYLWPRTPIPDTDFARALYERQNVSVLPGSFLSRESDGVNPGVNRVRMALVAPLDECLEAAERIRELVTEL